MFAGRQLHTFKIRQENIFDENKLNMPEIE